MPSEYQQSKQRVDDVLLLAENIADGGTSANLNRDAYKLQSELACYSCILMSGMIEAACRSCVSAYAKQHCSKDIRGYIDWTMHGFQNPKHEKIMQRLSHVRKGYDKDICGKIERSYSDAVDSVVNIKNQLSHGRWHGTSYGQAMEYYERVLKYIGIIQDTFK